MADLERVRRLVAEQLAIVRRPERRRAIEAVLVEPRRETREWDYGSPGECYPYWVVGEAPERGILLAYCEHGFGPEFPWGFLFTHRTGEVSSEALTLGTDAQWNWYLEEAFVRAGLWDGPQDADEEYHLPPKQRGPDGSPAQR